MSPGVASASFSSYVVFWVACLLANLVLALVLNVYSSYSYVVCLWILFTVELMMSWAFRSVSRLRAYWKICFSGDQGIRFVSRRCRAKGVNFSCFVFVGSCPPVWMHAQSLHVII